MSKTAMNELGSASMIGHMRALQVRINQTCEFLRSIRLVHTNPRSLHVQGFEDDDVRRSETSHAVKSLRSNVFQIVQLDPFKAVTLLNEKCWPPLR